MENYGLLSILPPLLTIILAIVTKNVLVSLFTGIFLGVSILFKGNIFLALPALFRDVLFVQAADGYNASVMVLVLFIGGMVMLVSNSGGAAALAVHATKRVDSKRRAILAAWLAGLAIWFSDFANAMLVGPIFQPITDKLRVSREKLAWIVDATSAPVCMLVPLSGFGVFGMSCIEKEFANYQINMPVWETFLSTIPYQFYCLGALFLIPLIAYLNIDFGPMAKAEERTSTTGALHWPGAQPMGLEKTPDFPENATPRMSLVIIPICTIFIVFFAILIANGFPYKRTLGVNIRTGLTTGYFLGGMFCFALMVKYKIQSFKGTFDMYISGMKGNLFLVLVLLFAWSLSSVCKQLGTANYIVQAMQGNFPAWLVAPMLFIAGCVISFATGTSYGTFAILMPIAIPMANTLGAPLIPTIAAVFSGGIFGDHCSPISDTTILSSMGAGCDHIEHVRTQLPYAMLVGIVTFAAYAVVFWLNSAPATLALVAAAICLATWQCGKIWGVKTSARGAAL